MKKTTALILAVLATTYWLSATYAEEKQRQDPVRSYVDRMRAELSTGKVGIMTEVLDLDAKQSAVFWPIYQEYEQELFALGDRRLELTKQFVKAYVDKSLKGEVATNLAADWLHQQADQLALLKKYHARISKDLSPLTAAQFLQLEHRFATLIDAMIASELPLIESDRG